MLTDKSQKQYADDLSNGAIIALVVLVAASYITIFLDAYQGQNFTQFTSWQIAVMICAGVAYTLLVLQDEWVYQYLPRRGGWVIYFGLQFGLVLLIGVTARAHGQWWLMILPVMGGSAAYHIRTMIAIGVAAVLTIGLGYYIVLGNMTAVWVMLYSIPAVVFVLIFSRIAFRERSSRLEVERLAVQLQEANRKLSEYAAKIEELAIMRERNRMAREIHDSLGHYLTVANVQIRAAQAIMAQNPQKAQDALQKAHRLTQEGLNEVRQSVAALRESPADSRPLPDILQELVDEAAASGTPTSLTIKGETRPLGLKTTRAVYRTVQEGLTNIRKHAQAATAEVVLDYHNAQQVGLTITDNGQGTEAAHGGFGLLGMQERVNLLGGTMHIHTAVGKGFSLMITLPNDDEETVIPEAN